MIEYKFEGYEMFQNMIDSIQDDVVRYIFRVNVVQPQQEQKRQVTKNRYAEEGPKNRCAGKQVGRNDPCPCGSGKSIRSARPCGGSSINTGKVSHVLGTERSLEPWPGGLKI